MLSHQQLLCGSPFYPLLFTFILKTALSLLSFVLQPPLPKVVDDDDEDEEEEDEYNAHFHSLIDYATVKLVSPDQIKKHQP